MENITRANRTTTSAESLLDATQSPLVLSVVIPAFNERDAIAQTIAEVRDSLSSLPIDYEIVVVDDGSRDGTLEAAQKSGARVIANKENRGYGASLKRGILAGNSTYVAIIDADGTYPARFLPRMLEMAAEADMIVGDRSANMTNVPAIRRPAKAFLNHFANFLAKRKIPDLNSGLRVFRRSSLMGFLPLLPPGFSFTTTITLCMICSDLQVEYLPIEYRKRIGKSSMRATDFFKFLLLVVRAIVLFSPLRVFIPLGALLFLGGISKLIYDIVQDNLSEGAVLGLLGAVMIWSLGLLGDMIARLLLRRNDTH
jgi:glycosyltransferase involved in cell wall biosynthesis